MDTLEYRVEYLDNNFNIVQKPPIVWRNKTPYEVFRAQYSDRYSMTKNDPPPKSTRAGVDYLESYTVAPHRKENDQISQEEGGRTYATLVPLPEKR